MFSRYFNYKCKNSDCNHHSTFEFCEINMSEKIITLISNASMDQYPGNTISDFRCKLYCPVNLSHGNWEVALTSLSYLATEMIVNQGEHIAVYYDGFRKRKLTAPISILTLDHLFTYINANTDFNMELDEYGYVTMRRVTGRFSVIKFSERIQYLLGIWEYTAKAPSRKKRYNKIIGKAQPVLLKEAIPEHIAAIFDNYIETEYIESTEPVKHEKSIDEDDSLDESLIVIDTSKKRNEGS